MEKELLAGILYDVHHTPIRDIKTLKDYYKTFTSIDITNTDLDKLDKLKKELEWAIENPGFDFKQLMSTTSYSNQELVEFLKIYYQHILFTLEKYNTGKFILTMDDLPDD